MTRLTITILFTLALAAGCGGRGSHMSIAEHQALPQPPADEARVVILRPDSGFGMQPAATLYEVTDGNIEFLGILVNGHKLSYRTTPGRHVFMVVSEAADFMEADLSGGRNYYGVVTTRVGLWKARFSLWPIKADESAEYHLAMPKFRQWLDSATLVENSDKTRAWYQLNRDNIQAKYDKYWPRWQTKTPEAIAQRSLAPDDGS